MLGTLRKALRRRAGLVAWGVTVGAVAVAMALGRAWVETSRANDEVDADLREARAELATLEDDHEVAVADLEALRGNLAAELATLATRQGERATAQAAADATAVALAEAQGRLGASNEALASSSDRLATLRLCLVGVSQALNQASVGDRSGLADTVEAIETTCAGAGGLQ